MTCKQLAQETCIQLAQELLDKFIKLNVPFLNFEQFAIHLRSPSSLEVDIYEEDSFSNVSTLFIIVITKSEGSDISVLTQDIWSDEIHVSTLESYLYKVIESLN